MHWTCTDERKPADEQKVLGCWPFFNGGAAETLTYHASDSEVDGRESWVNAWGESADPPDYWIPFDALPGVPRQGGC